jgi:hypothetical protein
LQKHFGHQMTILRPPNPQTAVLRGAVLFGLNQSTITSRVSGKTIGYEVSAEWNAQHELVTHLTLPLNPYAAFERSTEAPKR